MDGFLIEVKGEIKTIDSTPQYAVNWVCGSIGGGLSNCTFKYDENNKIVVHDLALSKNIRAVPYATYYTTKGIEACKGDLSAFGSGCGGAYKYYKEYIDDIKQCLNIEIPPELSNCVYNGLYVEITSILELFLCDALLSCIYSNNQYYSNAIHYYTKHSKKKFCDSIDSQHFHKYYRDTIIYHRYDVVKSLYEDIVGICFPSVSKLKIYLKRRDNIVHRFALSSNSRMIVTNADRSIVECYLNVVEEFVNELFESICKKM